MLDGTGDGTGEQKLNTSPKAMDEVVATMLHCHGSALRANLHNMVRRLVFFVVAMAVMWLPASARSQSGNGNQAASPSMGQTNSGATIQPGTPAAQSSPAEGNSGQRIALQKAGRLLATGKAAEAQATYQEVLKADPASIPAQVGLIHSFIMQQKLEEARAATEASLAQNPNSPEILLVQGDLQFAGGNFPDAERSYIKAQNLKPTAPGPYLGLAHVYRANSLYRRAFDNMKRAHELAPNDVTVQLLWFHSLPQEDRIPALQYFLATPAPNPQTAKALQQYLAFLKKNAGVVSHPCKLVSQVHEMDTSLYPIARGGAALGASGLAVKINNQEMHLALDTGASGVLLGRAAADKLGLERLGYQAIAGTGDSGKQGGFAAVANRIRVGDLEFADCPIRVTEAANPVTGQDGLIGPDVFSAYLVDIDIPGAELRLSPLPKRPDEAAAPTALKTLERESDELESEGPDNAPSDKSPAEVPDVPRDAYVAPEMSDWAKVYRFGHLLLIPTKVNDTGPMFFLIDTGAFNNVLAIKAAQELTQLRSDPHTSVMGLSGSVGKVYRAEKATLNFGRYEQKNEDIVTFDLSNMSRATGTQVSGILGFNMLRMLQVKIDYRDGLVDFHYDPNRLPKQLQPNK